LRSGALIPITVSYKLTYEQSHYRREAIRHLPASSVQAIHDCVHPQKPASSEQAIHDCVHPQKPASSEQANHGCVRPAKDELPVMTFVFSSPDTEETVSVPIRLPMPDLATMTTLSSADRAAWTRMEVLLPACPARAPH